MKTLFLLLALIYWSIFGICLVFNLIFRNIEKTFLEIMIRSIFWIFYIFDKKNNIIKF